MESAQSSASASQSEVAVAWETLTAALVRMVALICEWMVHFVSIRDASFLPVSRFLPFCPEFLL